MFNLENIINTVNNILFMIKRNNKQCISQIFATVDTPKLVSSVDEEPH